MATLLKSSHNPNSSCSLCNAHCIEPYISLFLWGLVTPSCVFQHQQLIQCVSRPLKPPLWVSLTSQLPHFSILVIFFPCGSIVPSDALHGTANLSISLYSYFPFIKDERDGQRWYQSSTSLYPFLCWGIINTAIPNSTFVYRKLATRISECQHIMDIIVHYEDHNDVVLSRSQSVTDNKSVISITKQNIQ